MKKYSELTTVNRGAPCQEYPGKYQVFFPGNLRSYVNDMLEGLDKGFPTLESAKTAMLSLVRRLEEKQLDYNPRQIALYWSASLNDPRIGKVWFTPFYSLGHMNAWGEYKAHWSFLPREV